MSGEKCCSNGRCERCRLRAEVEALTLASEGEIERLTKGRT